MFIAEIYYLKGALPCLPTHKWTPCYALVSISVLFVGFKTKYQIKVRDILRGSKKTLFRLWALFSRKKKTESGPAAMP